jgi:hypothetical protein
MEKFPRSIMIVVAPTVIAVLLLGIFTPGTALLGSTTTETLVPHGYVVVTVTRDGQEIYRNEEHNLITNAGKDFISAQIGSSVAAGGSAPGSTGANFIALSSDTTAPAATDTTLTGEVTDVNGLARAQGTYSHTAGQATFTISKTFSATGTYTNVQKAGLFTASSSGTMMAENTFSPVSLANGDQLTITWTITLS